MRLIAQWAPTACDTSMLPVLQSSRGRRFRGTTQGRASRLGQASIVMTLDRYSHLFPAHHDGAELAAAERALFAK